MIALIHFFHRHHPALSKNAWRLLAGLLVADVWFISMHILFSVTGFSDDLSFRLSHEGGYAEQIQYSKWLLTTVFFVYLAWHDQRWLHLVWGVVFGYLFLDDMLAIHEIAGEYLDGWFEFATAFGLRPQDIGEMAVFALSGTVLLTLIAVFYRRSPDARARQVSRFLLIAVLTLGFFGIFVDVAHSLVGSISTSRAINIAMTILEEGSEHFILTGIVVYVFLLVEQAFYGPPRLVNRNNRDFKLVQD